MAPSKITSRESRRPYARRVAPFLVAIGSLGWHAPAAADVIPWNSGPEYPIVIDPGHGGTEVKRKDDKWDPISKTFLDSYANGTADRASALTEHEAALALGKRVRFYLELTQSQDGWKQFEEILRQFSAEKEFKRIRFRTNLSREDSYLDRKEGVTSPDVNAPFRLYDAYDSKGRFVPGRISVVNKYKPYLVVAIHLNPAGRGNPGGMAGVLAPGFRTFELLREISLKKKPAALFLRTPWHSTWLESEPYWSKMESALGDAWVYYHGYKGKKDGSGYWAEKYRGLRQNMVQWRYSDPPGWIDEWNKHGPGPYALKYSEFKPEGLKFWGREKGKAEAMRREDGPVGYGGDNHYATDEILRYVQYGSRRMVPELSKPGAVGNILPPFATTYSLPTFVNAICAYLEIGHINVDRDRRLVTTHRETVAKSIAAGIYSLFMGMRLKPGGGPYIPRGNALNFQKYETLPGGNYFDSVL